MLNLSNELKDATSKETVRDKLQISYPPDIDTRLLLLEAATDLHCRPLSEDHPVCSHAVFPNRPFLDISALLIPDPYKETITEPVFATFHRCERLPAPITKEKPSEALDMPRSTVINALKLSLKPAADRNNIAVSDLQFDISAEDTPPVIAPVKA